MRGAFYRSHPPSTGSEPGYAFAAPPEHLPWLPRLVGRSDDAAEENVQPIPASPAQQDVFTREPRRGMARCCEPESY